MVRHEGTWSAWGAAAIGIPASGFAIFRGVVELRSEMRGPRRRARLRREDPLLLAVDKGWLARVPVDNVRSGVERTEPGSSPRGRDLANAGATMGVWLCVPIAASVAFVVFDGQPNAFWLPLLWALGLGAGSFLCWEAWHGRLDGQTFRVSPDYAELYGRTAWPLRRRRSIRLDPLKRVSCRKVFDGRAVRTYFILRAHGGGHVMLEDTMQTRAAVLMAVTRHPGARVGYVASRQLAGMFTWWVYPLAGLALFPYLGATIGAAFTISFVLGALE